MSCETAYLCCGSACRKDKRALKKVRSSLPRSLEVRGVKCQKICKGPVVGLKSGKRVSWFARLDSNKSLDALTRAVRLGELAKPLKKRWVKKRENRVR